MDNRYTIALLILCLIGGYYAGAQTEVTYYTSMGSFKIMLTDTLTPRTVDSFKSRVSQKFYDGLIFHRVIDSFMIQGGDPLGTGYGGPGYTTPDEFNSNLKNLPGALAMANSGPSTNGSQFYINLVNNAYLNNHYTVFGMVTTGFNVVQSIGRVPTNSSDKPLTNVYIDSIRITYAATAIPHVGGHVNAAIYPNPCKGLVSINLPAITTSITLVNSNGQTVYSASAKGLFKISLENLPAGVYIIRLANAAGSDQQKLMIE